MLNCVLRHLAKEVQSCLDRRPAREAARGGSRVGPRTQRPGRQARRHSEDHSRAQVVVQHLVVLRRDVLPAECLINVEVMLSRIFFAKMLTAHSHFAPFSQALMAAL